jgi:preprotein translocase subunit YajC
MQLNTESRSIAESSPEKQIPWAKPNEIVPAVVVLLVMGGMFIVFMTMFIRDQKDLKRRQERSRNRREQNDRIFARTLAAIETQRLAEVEARRQTLLRQQSPTIPVTPAEVAERRRRITRLY